jgi:hypothetical protein
MEYFQKNKKAGEILRRCHKVNPIDFENLKGI